jgi:O-antigen/teichoic acid export membrane protein
MAWISPSLSLFVCVQFILAAIEMLVLRGYLRRRVPALRNGAWRNDVFARTRSFAGGLTGVALLGIVLAQGDKLLLSALLPLEQFGFVTLAVMVAGSLGLVATPTFSLSYPRLSERAAAGDEGTFADEYRRWTQWLGVLVLPAAALLIFFPRDLLALWTRNDAVAQAAAPLVALWTVGTALNALMHMPYAAQLAQGWTRLSLALNALAATLLLPLTLWLVPRFGPVAAGWIWACINLLCVTVGVPLMHRRIMRGGLISWYSRTLLLPGLAAFAVTGAVAAWRDMQPALAPMPLLALLACTLAAAGAAAVAVTPYPRAMIGALLRRAD